jgi:hypothetical protein
MLDEVEAARRHDVELMVEAAARLSSDDFLSAPSAHTARTRGARGSEIIGIVATGLSSIRFLKIDTATIAHSTRARTSSWFRGH